MPKLSKPKNLINWFWTSGGIFTGGGGGGVTNSPVTNCCAAADPTAAGITGCWAPTGSGGTVPLGCWTGCWNC